jgi:parallel beta-helix repeat protein
MIFKASAITAALFAAQLTGGLADPKRLNAPSRTRNRVAMEDIFDHETFSGTVAAPKRTVPVTELTVTEPEVMVVTNEQVDALPVCHAPTTIDDLSCGITLDGGSYILESHVTCVDMGLFITNGGVLDCQGHFINGDFQHDSTGVELSNGAVLKNCIIHGFETGIHMSGNSIVGESSITNSVLYGIHVGFGDNKIVDTTVSGVSGPIEESRRKLEAEPETPSMGRGIQIYGNGNNIVSSAQVSNANSIGIYINGQGNNVVSCSTASNNGLDESLTQDRDGLLIDGNGNNVVTGSTFSYNGGSGIYLWQAEGSSHLVGCTAIGNGDNGTDEFESGLVIEKSGDVFVSGGEYTDNMKDGIFALDTFGLITIEGVDASGNERNGIYFSEALTKFRVMGSTISSNGALGATGSSPGTAGVRVNDSTGTISCSTIENNNGNGVEVVGEGAEVVNVLDSIVSNNKVFNIHVHAGTTRLSRVSACGSGDEFEDVMNATPSAATIILDSVTCEGDECDYDCSCTFELPSWCTSTC